MVKSRYDDVDVVLQNFKIPYDIISYRDLEDRELVGRYRSLFVPSSVDNPMEESLDVYANNFRFKSVALKPDFYKVDSEKVARTIRLFVKNGGSAYFSGYAFEYLQKAFDLFEFFDNFPYMGLPARVEATLMHDLLRFTMKNRMDLNMDYPGWIAIKGVRKSEVIASATFETPRGIRSGPLGIIARKGNGELIYTSCDSMVLNAFRRFNIYRIAGVHLMKKLEAEAATWNQHITGRIIDSTHMQEYAGMHRIDLAEGNNSIYFYSEKDFYQIDILDQNFSLIESRDFFQKEQLFSIISSEKDYCYIKLYPSTTARYGMYAVVSASGKRIVPYFNYILAVLGTIIAAGIVFAVYKLFFSTGYSGRWRG